VSAQASIPNVRIFPLLGYVEEALKRAEYYPDDQGVFIGKVPECPGFFAQGNTRKTTEQNLRDVIEGNLLLALQLGFEIPPIKGINSQYVETDATQYK
jgi:predicted RNase H-like HicB family nuclease